MQATIQRTQREAIGLWIAYQRKQMGLTQAQLAAEVGVHFTTMNRTEMGLRDMKVKELRKLAEFFGVEEQYLLSPPVPPTVTVSGPSLDWDDPDTHNDLEKLRKAKGWGQLHTLPTADDGPLAAA